MATKNQQIPIQGYNDHDAFQIEPPFAANVRNVRSLRERIVRSPGGTLLAPTPLPGVSSGGQCVDIGTFLANHTTGAQTFTHALGTTPKALILWTSNSETENETDRNFKWAYGFTDGTTSRAMSMAAQNADPSSTSRRYANALLTLVNASTSTTHAECTFTSWTSTSVTINWTVAGGSAGYEVNFCIIGDPSVSAKVLEWTATVGTGNQAVTGVGFQPQLVVHMSAVSTSLGATAGATFSHGAMNATAQYAISSYVGDARRNNCTAANSSSASAILANNSTGTGALQANFVSLDADGFTVNKIGTPTDAYLIASLCFTGFANVAVGNFNIPVQSAPYLQQVTGVGFRPLGGMTCNVFGNVSPALLSSASRDMAMTVGGFSYLGSNCASIFQDSQAVTQNGKFLSENYMVSTHQGGGGTLNLTQRTQGQLKSMDADGFTVNWVKIISSAETENNDYVNFYWAVASSGSAFTMVGVPRNYPEVYVDPAGPAVQKYVMLTSLSAFIYTPVTSSTGTFDSTSEAYTGDESLRFSIANTQGIAAWSQGVDNVRQWDGTNFSDLVTTGTNFAADTLLAFNDRIVAVRPTIAGILRPTQIRWCVNGDVNDWGGTGSGSLEVIETSQAPLQGGFVLGNRCYLGKQRELIELIATGTLNPVFATANRVSGMGILAPRSIGLAEQFAFWLGPDDVYMWDGSTLTAIGERIYNTLCSYINYQELDQIQGAVYTPDSQYWLVIPPYVFIYDYRRDIWDWDDVQNFAAIGVFNVSNPFLTPTNFTADIDKSEFIVIGSPACVTTRVDFQATDWLGAPIDSYFETKDYTAEELVKSTLGGGWRVTLWDLNSLREVRFQAPPGNLVECAVSLDRGQTWVDVQNVTINDNGVGVAWFQRPFSQIRFRFRNFSTDAYEIRGQWGTDVENSGYQLP